MPSNTGVPEHTVVAERGKISGVLGIVLTVTVIALLAAEVQPVAVFLILKE